MKLLTGKIIHTYCLNVRILRSGRVMPTPSVTPSFKSPAKPAAVTVKKFRFAPATKLHDGGRCYKEGRFNWDEKEKLVTFLRRGEWTAWGWTTRDYCRYMNQF